MLSSHVADTYYFSFCLMCMCVNHYWSLVWMSVCHALTVRFAALSLCFGVKTRVLLFRNRPSTVRFFFFVWLLWTSFCVCVSVTLIVPIPCCMCVCLLVPCYSLSVVACVSNIFIRVVNKIDPFYIATRMHVAQLMTRYGVPLTVLNLVKVFDLVDFPSLLWLVLACAA